MNTPRRNAVQRPITQIMESAYIDYSMSVIISRALPDVRDGLKPVQRRILYAMLREGLLSKRPFDKCAGVVGEVLKNYHPHGDASVYDTLTRMAQNWVMRHPLIEPQGNFGSVDGDPPAAYRYTECRLTSLAEELLEDIDTDTVDFVPNYKESTTEPSILPSALPNLLANGSIGIAVGMTTHIPPHNLGELIDAVELLINKPNCGIDEIMSVLPAPDFPTGGCIVGRQAIESYMKTGRGILRLRGTTELEELKNGKEQIIIIEIPYNVNRASLVLSIAELVRQKTLSEIVSVRDESDENTRIVLELKRGESSRVVLNKIAKHTTFETSFGVILLALEKLRPQQMNIKEMLEKYLEHRRDVVYRRTAFRLKKSEARAHILEGHHIALDRLDEIVSLIRESQNREVARETLCKKYPLSEAQANAILDLRLYQLTGLERGKIDEECQELQAAINEYLKILEDEKTLLKLIKKELKEQKRKHTMPRKTTVIAKEEDLKMEDIVPREGTIITVSHKGFIKRTPTHLYRTQKRGGKGVIGTGQYEEDFIVHLFTASTHDIILFFMNNGRVYMKKVYDIPEGTRISKGRSIANVLSLKEGETIAAVICLDSFESNKWLVMCTREGIAKKTHLSAYRHVRKDGIIGIVIEEDDTLIGCKLCEEGDEVILLTQEGMSIRFPVHNLRGQGRATRGAKGIKLKKTNDAVKAIEIASETSTLLIACDNGIGKRSTHNHYRTQKRGGFGIIAIKTKGKVVSALNVEYDDEVMLMTKSGQAVRTSVKDIRVSGRATQGVRLMRLKDKDSLTGVSKVVRINGKDA